MAGEGKSQLTTAAALVRNPLSVIAMFVLLVEAIATITLIQVRAITIIAVPLVWFVILFPTLIALLFFATIWWRHQFLYAPMEYRSDESFLTAMRRLQQVEARQEAADLNPRTADEAQSLKVVDRLLELGDVRSAVKVGRTFLEAGQHDVAERIFDHIVARTPLSHDARYNALANRAYAEIGLRKYAEAIVSLDESIRLAGADAGPWHYLALAYAHFRSSSGPQDEHRAAFEENLAKAKRHPRLGFSRDFFARLYPEIADRL